jgi:hypothetical protein
MNMTVLEGIGLIGGVASVAGLLYAINYARRSRRVKMLVYDTSLSVPLATAQSPEDEYSLSVIFQRKDKAEERIASAHVQFLRFANLGKEPVRRSDIAPANPLRVNVDGVRTLDIALSHASRPVARVDIAGVCLGKEHSHADLTFDFLDFQDGGVVKILTEGGRGKITISGDIIGMPEGIRRCDEIHPLGLLNKIGGVLVGLLMISALILVPFEYRWITGSWQHVWVLTLPFFAIIFPGVIIAIVASTLWPSEKVPLPNTLALPRWFTRLPMYIFHHHPDMYRGAFFSDDRDLRIKNGKSEKEVKNNQ